MTEMTTHKPCPFCGGEVETYGYIVEQTESKTIWNYCVSCYECDATGPSAYTEEEAWKAWDRRVENDAKTRGIRSIPRSSSILLEVS